MNWQQIIKDLQEAGVTQQEMARRCGTKQSTISSIATGKSRDTRYALGAALLRMHSERCKPLAQTEAA